MYPTMYPSGAYRVSSNTTSHPSIIEASTVGPTNILAGMDQRWKAQNVPILIGSVQIPAKILTQIACIPILLFLKSRKLTSIPSVARNDS